jgi:hypothetical protein
MDVLYDTLKRDLATGNVDLINDRIRAMLVIGYQPKSSDTMADIRSYEISAPRGYDRGGQFLTGKRLITTSGQTTWTADDVLWVGSDSQGCTFAADGMVLYVDSDVPQLVRPIMYCDFGEVKSVVASHFLVEFDDDGVLQIGVLSEEGEDD